jgi:hypothetical protein
VAAPVLGQRDHGDVDAEIEGPQQARRAVPASSGPTERQGAGGAGVEIWL